MDYRRAAGGREIFSGVMDLTCRCPMGTPAEKTVCSRGMRQVHSAKIIFKFQVFKKRTDININRPGLKLPMAIYTAFDDHLPHAATAVWVVVEKKFVYGLFLKRKQTR